MRSRSTATATLASLAGGRVLGERLLVDRRERVEMGDRCDGVDMRRASEANLNGCSVFSMITIQRSRNLRTDDLGTDPALFRGTIPCAPRQKIHAVS